jgi:hypothetical protein
MAGVILKLCNIGRSFRAVRKIKADIGKTPQNALINAWGSPASAIFVRYGDRSLNRENQC